MKEALDIIKSEDPYAVSRARAMMRVYHEVWGDKWAKYEIIDVEREFAFPLLNPDTESPSRSFDEAGKIDVLARNLESNRLVVIEHKTTADSVASDSDYWDRLRLDTQCSKYYLAASQFNLGSPESVLYDVLHKPAQRPSTIPKLDEHQFKIVLDASGRRVWTKDNKKPRETPDAEKGWVLQGRIETPDEFEARLLTVMRAAPGDFFAQREVPRMNSDLLEYMEDAWATGQQILYFRSKGIWARNPDACKDFGTCPMFDLCCGRASIDGVRYAKRDVKHVELKIQSGTGGRELLTTSRTKSFNRCRRLHKLQYEDGIERVEQESEALRMGTLVHLALETYFLTLKKNQTKGQTK